MQSLSNKLLSYIKNFGKFKAIAIIVAIAFIGPVLFFIYFPFSNPGNVGIVIENGDGVKTISRKMYDAGLIKNQFLFINYVKIFGYESSLKAGEYEFNGRINIPTLVSGLVSGKSLSNDIILTIPEGFNVWQIDKRLSGMGLITEGRFSAKYYGNEGYLFPDTYRLNRPADSSRESGDALIEELTDKMQENFNDKTSSILDGLTSAKRKEVIIIASMLEEEVQSQNDMELVAGIIYKRLEIGMALQIDATVRYGACMRDFIKSNYLKNCDVALKGPAIEIKIDTPYNSYTRQGLPPAPITNPGLPAIKATLNPRKSDYLYYLSAREDGRTVFSKTAEEHLANRKKYLGF